MNDDQMGCWYKTTHYFSGQTETHLTLQVPHDVFSTQRIDEGTLLLLKNLPKNSPNSILDLGCGYGALGIPLAARFPKAKVEMVDRDLLAVAWSKKNALENKLFNIDAYPSLGFDHLKQTQYDWILCNIPARIGEPFIRNFLELGCARLTSEGMLSIVVINDLVSLCESIQKDHLPALTKIEIGPRHTVFSIPFQKRDAAPTKPEILYFRDLVQISNLTLKRPFDFGGDDQKRIQVGFPILIDAFPRQPLVKGQNVLCIRSGYGAIPLLCRSLWPDTQVIAIERDLLGSTFIAHNANRLKFQNENLEIRTAPHFPLALIENEKFDLILGELSPSVGEAVTFEELQCIGGSLKSSGQALILCLEKTAKTWVKKYNEINKGIIQQVLVREGYTVLRMSHN